jgi:uncharacterized membrane protein (UPF0127 family)
MKSFLKKTLFIIFSFFLLSLLSILYFNFNWTKFVKDGQIIEVAVCDHFFADSEKTLKVKVVKSLTNLEKGLSGRSSLSDGEREAIEGMLFVFPQRKIANFWMKDMNFDIDICFLDDFSFVACARQAKAREIDENGNLRIFSSSQAVEMVLETNPDFIEKKFVEDQQSAKLFPQKRIFFLF